MFGEVKDGRQSVGHKEPVKLLLQEGWRASSVKCTVPKLYQPSTGASPKPFVITSNTELGQLLSLSSSYLTSLSPSLSLFLTLPSPLQSVQIIGSPKR